MNIVYIIIIIIIVILLAVHVYYNHLKQGFIPHHGGHPHKSWNIPRTSYLYYPSRPVEYTVQVTKEYPNYTLIGGIAIIALLVGLLASKKSE